MKCTLQELKQAYQIVGDDLVRKIKKAKGGEGIRFNDWGTFVKTQQKIKGWDNRKYVYWRVSFRTSSNLKRELDK